MNELSHSEFQWIASVFFLRFSTFATCPATSVLVQKSVPSCRATVQASQNSHEAKEQTKKKKKSLGLKLPLNFASLFCLPELQKKILFQSSSILRLMMVPYHIDSSEFNWTLSTWWNAFSVWTSLSRLQLKNIFSWEAAGESWAMKFRLEY